MQEQNNRPGHQPGDEVIAHHAEFVMALIRPGNRAWFPDVEHAEEDEGEK